MREYLDAELRDELKRRIDARRRELEADELPDDPWHGTIHGYDRRKCRCDKCRKASSDARRVRRQANREHENAMNREYKRRRKERLRQEREQWSASA